MKQAVNKAPVVFIISIETFNKCLVTHYNADKTYVF